MSLYRHLRSSLGSAQKIALAVSVFVMTVALTIVILIVVFVALGYLYVFIDKKLGEKIKKAEN